MFGNELICTVQQCQYNEDRHCCKCAIYINTNNRGHIFYSKETRCESFKRNNARLFVHKNIRPKILCEAKNCAFNLNGNCEAEIVRIENEDTLKGDEPRCASFIET